jgi:hypothetical protein
MDGILHLSALCYQQIEDSCSFIGYNFNNSLLPDDALEFIYWGAIALGPVFCPDGRNIVLNDLLRRPFIFSITNL